MSYRVHRLLLLPVLLLASNALVGLIAIHAQTPQTAPTSSRSTPDAPRDQQADYPRQIPNPDAGHATDNAWKDLLRDAEQMGMRNAARRGGSMNAGDLSDGGAGMNFTPDSGANYGSAGMHMGSGFGAGIGSRDFNGGISNGFSGTAGNASGGGMGAGFRGGSMGAGATGSSASGFNLGSLSQLAGDLGLGLSGSGHPNAGAILGAVPSFNQMMRGGLSLPINSSLGNVRFSYQSPFSLSSNLQMNSGGYGSGFATYDSPHARSSRIDFSASAKVGMGSMNGMGSYGSFGMNQGGTGGSHGPGGHGPGGNSSEQPATSVSFRLAF